MTPKTAKSKTALIVCAALALLAAAGWFLQTRVPDDAAQCARQPRLPWAELFRVLQANDAKATAVWTNECVRISGVVTEVAPDGAFVLLGSTTEAVDAVACLPLHRERAAELVPGRPLNVWGFGEPRLGPRYSLKACDWER